MLDIFVALAVVGLIKLLARAVFDAMPFVKFDKRADGDVLILIGVAEAERVELDTALRKAGRWGEAVVELPELLVGDVTVLL